MAEITPKNVVKLAQKTLAFADRYDGVWQAGSRSTYLIVAALVARVEALETDLQTASNKICDLADQLVTTDEQRDAAVAVLREWGDDYLLPKSVQKMRRETLAALGADDAKEGRDAV